MARPDAPQRRNAQQPPGRCSPSHSVAKSTAVRRRNSRLGAAATRPVPTAPARARAKSAPRAAKSLSSRAMSSYSHQRRPPPRPPHSGSGGGAVRGGGTHRGGRRCTCRSPCPAAGPGHRPRRAGRGGVLAQVAVLPVAREQLRGRRAECGERGLGVGAAQRARGQPHRLGERAHGRRGGRRRVESGHRRTHLGAGLVSQTPDTVQIGARGVRILRGEGGHDQRPRRAQGLAQCVGHASGVAARRAHRGVHQQDATPPHAQLVQLGGDAPVSEEEMPCHSGHSLRRRPSATPRLRAGRDAARPGEGSAVAGSEASWRCGGAGGDGQRRASRRGISIAGQRSMTMSRPA